jgi:hypothetical protein
MTDPTTLLALAERCEQAAGPDAGLDLAIWNALSEMPGFKHPSPIWRFDVTASLDAAVTTVPEGCGWMVMSSAAKVGVWPSHGATPALALCAAALRARAVAHD